jgi:hypothetical protein
MRSRPDVEVTYGPEFPRAGERVRVEVVVIGKSETPVNRIVCTFRTIETRITGYVSTGKSTAPVSSTHVHFEQAYATGASTLAAGERKDLSLEFALPAHLPSAYSSRIGSIDHRLEVRVDIPWWPDRTARYLIPVRARPRRLVAGRAVYATHPDGPRGTELSLELGLESEALELGSVLKGAASLLNAEHHNISRLELRLKALDATVPFKLPETVFDSGAMVLCSAPVPSGKTFPFEVAIPSGAPPSFVAKHTQVVWTLELRAVRPLLPDLTLETTLEVADHAPAPDPKASRPPPLALGDDRRRLVWTEVAKRASLTLGPSGSTVSGEAGPIRYSIGSALDDETLLTVARLEWPHVRLGLDLRERRWSDLLKKTLSLDHAAFDERFSLRARELGQAKGFLSAEVLERLLAFDQVSLDDDSAELASAGNAYDAQDLLAFVEKAQQAVRALRTSVENIPPPDGLGPQRAAWSALAVAHGGVFHPGDFSIREASYRGHRVELLSQFDAQGLHAGIVARVLLAAPVQSETLSAEAQRVLASLSAEIAGVQVGAQWVEAPLAGTVLEPAKAENLWRQLQRLARALEPGPA